jgi:hypothetical protein
LARPIYHPNEPIRLAVFYPLDTSPDIRPVRTVKSAVDRSTRHTFRGTAPRGEYHVPVCPLVQAGELILPDFVVFAEKPGDGPLGGFDFGMVSLHPKSPFLQLSTGPGSVVELATLQKRIFREHAGEPMRGLRHSSEAFLTREDQHAATLTSLVCVRNPRHHQQPFSSRGPK